MITNDLTVGKTALVNHCNLGWVDVEITKSLSYPLSAFYGCKLLKVHLKDVRVEESALFAMSQLAEGQRVDLIVHPLEFIRYK